MLDYRIFFLTLGTIYCSTSCVSTAALVARGTAKVVPSAEAAVQQESSYEAWRRGGVSSIQMLEGMLASDPSNPELTAALAKAYNGYATLVAETDALQDQLVGQGSTVGRDLATDYHARAIQRARQFLELQGLRSNQAALDDLLKGLSQLSRSQQNVDMAFVAAHSLKSLVGLRRDVPTFLELLPLGDAFAQWSCSESPKPTYPTWACEVMQAAELAEKPVVAGGNPADSRKRFDALIARHPDDLMLYALRAQLILTKLRDKAAWTDSKLQLQRYHQRKIQTLKLRAAQSSPPDKDALMNEAGMTRLHILARHESDLF